MVQLRYFAAAQDFAGRGEETRTEQSVAQLRTGLSRDYPGLASILPRCALLVNGSRVDDETSLSAGDQVDVLPPFAGG